jgi:diguanylate cyclase (GGDEF)-like protein
LTGLLNHRAFHKRFAEEESRARRQGTSLALIVMDLHNFKFFNDVYGHLVGDDVLRMTADALKCVYRDYDVIARFGGDEFAILLPEMRREHCVAAIKRFEDAVMELGYVPAGQETKIPLRVSIGSAIFPDDGASRLDVLAAADLRLQRSKQGRNDDFADQLRAAFTFLNKEFTILDSLVAAVDNKDRYTRRHSEDVLSYCIQIAQAVGMDDAVQHVLAQTALLHDVGKIGVPDFILRKPGRLTDDEMTAIRQHPVMGAAIVSAVPGFQETLDGIRYHHERWDGKGYPDGLSRDATPILGRLIAVADGFSAMTTDRPYRKGMDEETALAVLEAGAGTQWDPEFVAAFVKARRGGSPHD